MRQEINPEKTGTNRAAHKGTQTDTLTKGKGKTGTRNGRTEIQVK